MSEQSPTATGDIEQLLARLQESYQALLKAINRVEPDVFQAAGDETYSVRRILERSADDVNFYYGRLIAQAVSLPQPPGLEQAEFASLAEAKSASQLAHRRLANLLHDLTQEDLDRTTRLESTGEFTLRQVLETAIAHYNLRVQQLGSAGKPKKTTRK